MTRIILTVENKKQSNLLSSLLRSVSFIKNIQEEEYDEALDEETKKMLDRRSNDYESHPEKFISYKEFKKRLSKRNAA